MADRSFREGHSEPRVTPNAGRGSVIHRGRTARLGHDLTPTPDAVCPLGRLKVKESTIHVGGRSTGIQPSAPSKGMHSYGLDIESLSAVPTACPIVRQ